MEGGGSGGGRGGGSGSGARRTPRISCARFSASARGTAAQPPTPALLEAGEVSTPGELGRFVFDLGAGSPCSLDYVLSVRLRPRQSGSQEDAPREP